MGKSGSAYSSKFAAPNQPSQGRQDQWRGGRGRGDRYRGGHYAGAGNRGGPQRYMRDSDGSNNTGNVVGHAYDQQHYGRQGWGGSHDNDRGRQYPEQYGRQNNQAGYNGAAYDDVEQFAIDDGAYHDNHFKRQRLHEGNIYSANEYAASAGGNKPGGEAVSNQAYEGMYGQQQHVALQPQSGQVGGFVGSGYFNGDGGYGAGQMNTGGNYRDDDRGYDARGGGDGYQQQHRQSTAPKAHKQSNQRGYNVS